LRIKPLAKRLLLLSGLPGVGKTTVVQKVVEELKTEGFAVGGMLSREVRSGASRVGFEIQDIGSQERGWLAHVDQRDGPRVGRYRVNLRDLNRVGAEAILRAASVADAVVVDEVGPMETLSPEFRRAVETAVESDKLFIGVVHWKAHHSLIRRLKERQDAETFVVTQENRGSFPHVIAEKAVAFILAHRRSAGP